MKPIVLLPLFCSLSLFAMSKQSSQKTTTTVDENDSQTSVIQVEDSSEEDLWYGPGFYYGVWFEDEGDYWNWRNNHQGYPPNHRYYDPHNPVHYHPHDGHNGRDHQGGAEHGGKSHGGEGHGGGGHGGGGHGR